MCICIQICIKLYLLVQAKPIGPRTLVQVCMYIHVIHFFIYIYTYIRRTSDITSALVVDQKHLKYVSTNCAPPVC